MPFSLNAPGILWEAQASLREYTTARIGGIAPLLLKPQSIEALFVCLETLTGIGVPFCMLGKGSNVLIRDQIQTPVWVLTTCVKEIQRNGERLIAGCGVPLPLLAKEAMQFAFCGVSSWAGIPGTVGGAIRTNAGAFGGTISDFLEAVWIYDSHRRKRRRLSREVLAFSYRSSLFLTERHLIILSAVFHFPQGDVEAERRRIRENRAWRRAHQPSAPGCGSIFRKTEGAAAWRFIDDIGFRGRQVGNVKISEKHCNFLENMGDASFQDAFTLIEQVREHVYRRFGVFLTPEPEILE